MTPLPASAIRRAVRQGLEEDLSQGDVTTSALFGKPIQAWAIITAQQPLVVAGMAAAIQTFIAVDARLQLSVICSDGQQAKNGDILLRIEGDGRSILMAERVALNFLQHLSGIATLTQRFCRAVRPFPAAIMDTRKTLPGWRAIQKWAVALGGGANHRMSLGDGILVKDNHLALFKSPQKAIGEACRLVKKNAPDELMTIVEAESLAQVRQALAGRADIILLDNMTVSMVKQAIKLINGRALVEVSGGITLRNVRAMAAVGLDRISIGALTHSAPAASMSLELRPAIRNRKGRS